MCVLHRWRSGYGSGSTSAEYLHTGLFCSWILIVLMVPFLTNSACSNFVPHSFHVWSITCWSWHSDNEINLMVMKLLVCHFSLNTAAVWFCYYSLTWRMTHVHSLNQLRNYYYWWTKCWCVKCVHMDKTNDQTVILVHLLMFCSGEY